MRPLRRRLRGFSLLELIVVLAVLGAVAAAVPTLGGQVYESMQMRSAVGSLVLALREARQQAMRDGAVVPVRFDTATNHYATAGGAPQMLPDGVHMALTVDAATVEGTRGEIRFYPDGGASGGDVALVRPAGGGVRISVDWLLGRVSQHRLPAA